MPKITLDQFIKQWESKMPIANRVDFNITEFATKAGEYSKRFFRMSFTSGGFYATGNKWKPRESRWGKKYTHEVLNDTGMLKGSMSGKSENISRQSGKKVNGRTPFTKMGAVYNIHTEEISQSGDGKRGSNPQGKGYAAVHNTDPKISPFTVNQRSKKKPEQRQFIGFNDRLNDYINTHYVPIIFKGLPQ